MDAYDVPAFLNKFSLQLKMLVVNKFSLQLNKLSLQLNKFSKRLNTCTGAKIFESKYKYLYKFPCMSVIAYMSIHQATPVGSAQCRDFTRGNSIARSMALTSEFEHLDFL